MDLTVRIREGTTGYWAEIAELPGCFASGRTLNELGEALGEAIGLYVGGRAVALDGTELEVGTVSIRVDPPAGSSSSGEG